MNVKVLGSQRSRNDGFMAFGQQMLHQQRKANRGTVMVANLISRAHTSGHF